MSTSDWQADIHHRMFERRALSIFGTLDDARATSAAAEIWTLDANGDDPIQILFSCNGGTASAALALVDVMSVVGIDIQALCVGMLSGPAVVAYASAHKRLAAPNARFALRDETISAITGSALELTDSAHLHLDQRHALAAQLSSATRGRRSPGDVLLDFDARRTLSAVEARDYGIVDEIVSSENRIVAFRPPPRLGFRPDH